MEVRRSRRRGIEKARDDPSQVALHSLLIGAVTSLAAEGEVLQRVIPEKVNGRYPSHPRCTPETTRKMRLSYLAN